ncbi:hypothetical protein VRU48_14885 [Pedobacter sp. KR3-3]|uniref:Uncharacterized protein n=1 Tax=Pedobacter albus TaxID=3113905 RepID=A0ABU7IAA6_9SPHI|nr:hypothetical protein [Pedobacter sp. KR3-3]MEE1946407.1 hypothetical protein [Pedobacter sp. KR3-3]
MDNKELFESYKALKGRDAFEARTKQGMLPIIEIAGYPFYVDVRIGFLRPKDDFSTMGIEIGRMTVDPETRNLSDFYDKQLKELVFPDEGQTSFPPNVVRLGIPNYYVLDPVGMARRHGKDDDAYYIQDGIRQKMYHKATVTRRLPGQKIRADVKPKPESGQKKVIIKRKSRGI